MRKLARGADAVAQGHLDHRIGIEGGEAGTDEIADVARNFNHMLDRLQATTVSRTMHEHRENELRKLLDSIHDYAIFVTDANGYVTTWNLASARIFGYESGGTQSASFARIFKDNETAHTLRDEAFAQIAAGGRFETDTRLMRTDGAEFDANVVISPLTGVDGSMSGYSFVVRDITRRRNAQRHIEQLATRDPLTGLLNRGMLTEQMNLAIARATRAGNRFALMFVDLDNFKSVNDTLGHVAGDALLNSIASRLTDCIREVDIVARWGGDEFVVLLADVDSAASVTPVAERMLKTVTAPLNLLGHHAQTSASIGICIYPEDGADTGTLMKHADIAMYQAKAEGKNNFQFYAEALDSNSLERLTLESSLRHALERNEFQLHYQARWDMANGPMSG
ncbi:MAG TPA: diguanylate cyclase, partial [Roseiflexaceae bacterium]|nr:diguanylate cyclase [Roseiflexaceae bacterium]